MKNGGIVHHIQRIRISLQIRHKQASVASFLNESSQIIAAAAAIQKQHKH
jgi:hypothetical protein